MYVMYVYGVQNHPFLVSSGSFGKQKLGGRMIAAELIRMIQGESSRGDCSQGAFEVCGTHKSCRDLELG